MISLSLHRFSPASFQRRAWRVNWKVLLGVSNAWFDCINTITGDHGCIIRTAYRTGNTMTRLHTFYWPINARVKNLFGTCGGWANWNEWAAILDSKGLRLTHTMDVAQCKTSGEIEVVHIFSVVWNDPHIGANTLAECRNMTHNHVLSIFLYWLIILCEITINSHTHSDCY